MEEADAPPIQVRHLLVCDSVTHDPDRPGAAYSLNGLIVSIRPTDDYGYPLVAERLWLFAQVYGAAGRYPARIDLYRVNDADGDVIADSFTPSPIPVRAGKFVEGVAIPLNGVVFPLPGVYEFRLTLEGYQEPLASERVLLSHD